MEELEKFKREINLAEFAQLYGYRIDKDKSSRSVKQLRNDNTGDKIVVSQYDNGHYVYFSMRNDTDNGTIIDFIQHRTGKNLGEVRKELRGYLSGDRKEIQQFKIIKSNPNRNRIFRIWESIKSEEAKQWRGIRSDLLQKAVDTNRLKIVDKAYYFGMWDLEGLCGIEKRTYDKKRVITGSQKGLWVLGKISTAKYIIITESPLDSLSYIQLKSIEPNITYLIATMGTLSKKAKEALKEIEKRSKGQWIIATDNDEGGEKLAKDIKNIVNIDHIIRDKPTKKDWNEELADIVLKR